MKVVFLGTGAFAVPSLEAVHRAGHDVSLVVSQPDRPQGRGLALKATPVKKAAETLQIPVHQPEKLRLDAERVLDQKADILVVVAYGQILREQILTAAPRGAINVHASLLPRYRGAAPIQWALARGETETGVTTMQLDRGMDTGPVLLQRRWPIDPGDTTASLEPKLAAIGASLLVETLSGLSEGSLQATPQDDALATRAPLIRKQDGLVSFELTSTEIVNRLRAFAPWPGTRFAHAGREVKVLAAAARPPAAGGPPGRILRVSREGVEVSCGEDTVLRLERVQPESRGPVSAFDFANGFKLRPGLRLGPSDEPDRSARTTPPD